MGAEVIPEEVDVAVVEEGDPCLVMVHKAHKVNIGVLCPSRSYISKPLQ